VKFFRLCNPHPESIYTDGGNLAVNEELANYREVRKSVEKARADAVFLVHLAVYIIGNIFLGIWNSLTYYINGNELLWFPIPLIFWGVGVLIHYTMSVALFNEWWERDESTIQSRN